VEFKAATRFGILAASALEVLLRGSGWFCASRANTK